MKFVRNSVIMFYPTWFSNFATLTMMLTEVNREMAGNTKKNWSRRVFSTSNALDLEAGVFTLEDPREIALSLKRSALRSKRRRVDPFRSAMSMLNFYINRAGRKLPLNRRKVLESAKNELRDVFGRPQKKPRVSR
jgi:hypothetical protein